MEVKDNLGVKRAARRKLEHELGIDPSEAPIEGFTYLTRLHYKAAFDEKWGEHEIDHILIMQRDVKLNVNENEIGDYKYVTPEELKQMIEDSKDPSKNLLITPWFEKIAVNFLFKWWAHLKEFGRVPEEDFDHATIHRL
eukprot:TRINITY_DN389_c0_g1_i2.p1 TRINITY_DN389_c0_g1~~TRINITY_DN389_c0_g1_i2.p1  ORF type:complete len:139 (-),score=71.56 TRINITY_DN389_c0_g1_i2:65-481(-)